MIASSMVSRQLLPPCGTSSFPTYEANMYHCTRESSPKSSQYDQMMDVFKERPSTPATIATSAVDSDDSNSVSSLSSNEDEDRRSIFRTYWKQNSNRIAPFAEATSRLRTRSISDEDSDKSNNTYERSLKEQEGIPRRRSIFGNNAQQCLVKQQSLPCFRMNAPLVYRKAVSDSELQCKRLPSCLRPSKYSGASSTLKKKCDKEVSFSERTHVVDYTIPVEVWAEDGWSKYFAP